MAVNAKDLESLSKYELIDELNALREEHERLKTLRDDDAQRIYDLNRQLETSKAAQAYLMQELEGESLRSNDNPLGNESTKKLSNAVDEYRRKYNDLKLEYEGLQDELESALQTISTLETDLKECKKNQIELKTTNNKDEVDELRNRFQLLEQEYMALLLKMDEMQQKDMENTFSLGAKDRQIDVLTDQIVSLEVNLNSKKEELEEKNQMLETTQDQLADAKSQIALLSTNDEKVNAKGNSLFAEVDDQRQAMKQLLNAQKKSFLEMKRKYNESDHEIRKLKREKQAMHAELDTCGKIFSKSRQDFTENLKARIVELQRQNERLEKHLKQAEDNFKNNSGQNVMWVDSVLAFCKQETNELKAEIRKVRMEKSLLEEEVRNLQQETARHRFENLRFRLCVVEYEEILQQNNLAFRAPNLSDLSKKVTRMSKAEKQDLSKKYMKEENEIEEEAPKRRSSIDLTKAAAEKLKSLNSTNVKTCQQHQETHQETIEISRQSSEQQSACAISEESHQNEMKIEETLEESSPVQSNEINVIDTACDLKDTPEEENPGDTKTIIIDSKHVGSILKTSSAECLLGLPTKKVHFSSQVEIEYLEDSQSDATETMEEEANKENAEHLLNSDTIKTDQNENGNSALAVDDGLIGKIDGLSGQSEEAKRKASEASKGGQSKIKIRRLHIKPNMINLPESK